MTTCEKDLWGSSMEGEDIWNYGHIEIVDGQDFQFYNFFIMGLYYVVRLILNKISGF